MSQIKYRPRTATTRIILHDSHTVPGQDWHPEARDGGLKMGLLGIGYHYIIEGDGAVIETRKRDLIGTHTPGHNMDSIGICLVGGRDHFPQLGAHQPAFLHTDNFTIEQRHALFDLVLALRAEFGPAKLLGHTEVQKYRNRDLPPCPCLDMDDLRQDLEVYALERKAS